MQYILLMAWGQSCNSPKRSDMPLACFNGQNLSISVLEICRSIFLLYNSHFKKLLWFRIQQKSDIEWERKNF